jgi:hypothetical protein
MRHASTLALILVGALVILAPLAAHVYSTNRDKERVAEFYSRNSNAAILPQEMHPTSFGFQDVMFFCGCWVAGVGMVVAGVRQARSV